MPISLLFAHGKNRSYPLIIPFPWLKNSPQQFPKGCVGQIDVSDYGLESEGTRWTHLKSEGGVHMHVCVCVCKTIIMSVCVSKWLPEAG